MPHAARLSRRTLMLAAPLAGVIMLQASGAAAQEQNDLARIVSSKVVRVGAIEAYPHYRKDLATGEWTGMVPDLTRLMFGSIGIKVEFVPTEWGTAAAGLQANKFDLVGAFNATPQRALVVDFSRIVAQGKIAVVGLSDKAKALTTWDSINKPEVRIAAVDGASTTRTAQDFLPNATWTLVKTNDAMLLELETGRADIVLSNETTLVLFVREKKKGTLVVPTPERGQPNNIAVRKGSKELQQWLNVALEFYQSTGAVEGIWDKYLNVK